MARRRGKLISLEDKANPRSEALSTLRGQRSADSVRRIQGRCVKHHHDRSHDHVAMAKFAEHDPRRVVDVAVKALTQNVDRQWRTPHYVAGNDDSFRINQR